MKVFSKKKRKRYRYNDFQSALFKKNSSSSKDKRAQFYSFSNHIFSVNRPGDLRILLRYITLRDNLI